ncbi:MAG TPA: lipopolysaccharide biosynthesis protein, partial [Thermoanaerobaculia bacterium]|nr:lipopolysaccharide biosynthesis protein [Thermoanaerobaculia bacterium]
LQENVRMRTDRASDTLDFFQGEVERLSAALAEQSKKIADFKTANVTALPDSSDSRRNQQEREEQRLLDLQREEAALKNQRATVVWVFERTGRAANVALSPEEEELQNLQSQLLQQQAIYKAGSPQIRVLQARITALQSLVSQQQAARAVPSADGRTAQPLSELDLELAPIDEQLRYIADERAAVEKTLADLGAALQATPQNERTLADFERELMNLQTQYDNAVAALGQAQVTEKIEVLSKGQRFTLIEAPIERNTPVSPPRLLIASAGIVGGLGAAVGFIVLWEMLNRSIRRPVELTQGLGIQPIATIPYIRTAGEQRRKRALILAILALIVIGIPLVLFAVHTQYMPLDQLLGGVVG